MKARLVSAALLFLSSPALADPIVGSWAIEPGDPNEVVQVRVHTCGSKICGTYEKLPAGEQGVGERMFWDMTARGGGSYSGGKIFTLDNGKTYSGKLEIKGNELKISGCLVGNVMCRGAYFERVN